METKRYNAYNSTRGTVLNAKLSVADRDVEPLRFLELLIGGLGLDSESGLWLKPLSGAPQVPRVFPFDLVYLDQNQKVIRAAEVFPSSDFPPFSDEIASALVLPLHAASLTKTCSGDQLVVRAAGEATESPELAAPALAARVLQGESTAAAQTKPLDKSIPGVPASGRGGQNWEIHLEGLWAPQAKAPEPAAKAMQSSTEAGGKAKAQDTPPVPASVPSAPVQAAVPAAKNGGAVDREAKKAPVKSASGSGIQSEGFTVAQYRNWQVSTSTPPVAALKDQTSPAQEPAANLSADLTRMIAKAESKKKPAEKSSPTPQTGESTSETPSRREAFLARKAEDQEKANSATRRPAAPRKDILLDAVRASMASAPAPVTRIGEASKTKESEPGAPAGSHSSVPNPVARQQDAPLPLWKASPSAPLADAAKASTSSPVSKEAEHAAGVERPRQPNERVAKRAMPKSLIDPTAHPPTGFSRLMTALHRIGASPEDQTGGKSNGLAPNKVSSWLDPDALHRDRRRAVRRAVPGMVAFYFTGGAPQPYNVLDISATGFYLITRDQWMPETMIQMTLQKPAPEGKQRKESLTVLAKIVRRAEDGIGAEFVMPEWLDPNSHDVKPGRATDRMALARFLFSEEFPDSFEVLGCFITPPVEQQPGL
jgi:hypothetical protein